MARVIEQTEKRLTLENRMRSGPSLGCLIFLIGILALLITLTLKQVISFPPFFSMMIICLALIYLALTDLLRMETGVTLTLDKPKNELTIERRFRTRATQSSTYPLSDIRQIEAVSSTQAPDIYSMITIQFNSNAEEIIDQEANELLRAAELIRAFLGLPEVRA